MSAPLSQDPLWPRAGAWLADSTSRIAGTGEQPAFAVLGVPAHLTSLSPTNAHRTPAAVREALDRYSTWCESLSVDLRDVAAQDLGDVADPDGPEGEARTRSALANTGSDLVVALGGDNSITYAVAEGLQADGLITFDAHHDLRDGVSNGSPVRRLVAGGLDGTRIVQIGINDFTNSREYSARAQEYGITVIGVDELETRGVEEVMEQALAIAGSGPAGRVHVDLDFDVCDRSVVPACPASAPGGISAGQLRRAARLAGNAPNVVGVDFTEVDATADTPDQRTVRLAALCLLDVAAGFMTRV